MQRRRALLVLTIHQHSLTQHSLLVLHKKLDRGGVASHGGVVQGSGTALVWTVTWTCCISHAWAVRWACNSCAVALEAANQQVDARCVAFHSTVVQSGRPSLDGALCHTGATVHQQPCHFDEIRRVAVATCSFHQCCVPVKIPSVDVCNDIGLWIALHVLEQRLDAFHKTVFRGHHQRCLPQRALPSLRVSTFGEQLSQSGAVACLSSTVQCGAAIIVARVDVGARLQALQDRLRLTQTCKHMDSALKTQRLKRINQ
mmetsp:Transcript_7670/g.11911  ORF Transcript_7670/g.11911 Transcript_7670/m.11911 type:complete len:257 (-) Transcript_7670:413-1183(-)